MSKESGNAAAGIKVSEALPRNAKITMTTRVKANTKVNCTSKMECKMVCER